MPLLLDMVGFSQFCSCDAWFSIEHSFSCPKGGFPTIRNNEIQPQILLTEVCHKVQVEPGLQLISGEQFQHATSNIEDGACLDISMNGFWGGKCEKTFLDVKVFNPYAASNRSSTPRAVYRSHKNMKKCSYQARICEVEHDTFTPLVFSATGWISDEAYAFYKHLASLLSVKWTKQYSAVTRWLRCCLSFSLLRSAIRCVRGSRSSTRSFTRPVLMTNVELIQAETGLSSSFD